MYWPAPQNQTVNRSINLYIRKFGLVWTGAESEPYHSWMCYKVVVLMIPYNDDLSSWGEDRNIGSGNGIKTGSVLVIGSGPHVVINTNIKLLIGLIAKQFRLMDWWCLSFYPSVHLSVNILVNLWFKSMFLVMFMNTMHVYKHWSNLFNSNLSVWPWPWLFMPPDRMIGGILFLSCLFVYLLSTLTFAITLEP